MTFKALLAIAALLLALPAAAGTPARVDLLPGWRESAASHLAALHVVLAPGWKTYWRAPGEAGFVPRFDWSGSENVASVEALWPVPEVDETGGMTSLVYHDELVLPLRVHLSDPARAARLSGSLEMGVCDNICMPMQVSVSTVLDAAQTAPDARIAAALASRPMAGAEAGLGGVDCTADPIADGMRVHAHVEMPALGAEEHAVIEGPSADIWVSDAMVERGPGGLTITADLVPPAARPFDLKGDDIRLTVLAEGTAVDIRGCPLDQ